MENFVITMPSDLTVDDAVEAIKVAAAEAGISHVAQHDMNDKLNKRGIELAPRCVIVEVCSAKYAKNIIERCPEVSSSLPCRISVYEKNGKTEMATLAMTTTLRIYKDAEIGDADREMENAILRLMVRAQGGITVDS